MTKIALMVRNSTLNRLPSEQGKKSDSTEGFGEKGQAGSRVLSFSKRKSGFAMARIV